MSGDGGYKLLRGLLRQVEATATTTKRGCLVPSAPLPMLTGYPMIDGMPVHRAAWLVAHGRLPKYPEFVLDHTCGTKACFRLSHLEVVSYTENLRRAVVRYRPQCIGCGVPFVTDDSIHWDIITEPWLGHRRDYRWAERPHCVECGARIFPDIYYEDPLPAGMDCFVSPAGRRYPRFPTPGRGHGRDRIRQ